MQNPDKGFELLFSFFSESEQIEYHSPHELIPQTSIYTCVSACVRMILADFDIYFPESYIASALETSGGAYPSKVPAILNEFGVEVYQWKNDLTIADLSAALENGFAIVSLKRENTKFGHSLIADAIINDAIRLRDPLPLGQGKSYAVALETFMKVWLRSGVVYVK
ncbi:MAG TPA: cysteine peptidase family C39 domain-containing protein [Pyrinomonadaceae bacterium]|nr:cysteine peptidase family C39 domain-containing protein [Pyrinomonadaceae bacterium]